MVDRDQNKTKPSLINNNFVLSTFKNPILTLVEYRHLIPKLFYAGLGISLIFFLVGSAQLAHKEMKR